MKSKLIILGCGSSVGVPRADGFFGNGSLPWNMILFGLLLGIVILGIDIFLDAKNYNFRLHLMPIAVGMYLPFGLSTPILIGGILSYLITIFLL